jgi:predicted HicB family RNase H-like nuclease
MKLNRKINVRLDWKLYSEIEVLANTRGIPLNDLMIELIEKELASVPKEK